MFAREHDLITKRLRAMTALASAFSLFVTQSAMYAYALPQGGQVNGGSATITSGATQMDVNQSSQRAILDWGSFNIGSGETVNFNQPNPGAVSLNRIHDANPSQIDGALNANGQVWLVNSQGIAFGGNAQVNVGGLLATSSDIGNSNFMSGGSTFDLPGNPLAWITNAGRIHIADGGVAALVGPKVVNSGVVQANLGKVQLSSGDMFTLDLNGDGLISIAASDAITSQLVENSGSIAAQGGRVLLSVADAAHAVNSLVNIGGDVQGKAITVSGAVIGITGSLDTGGASGGSIDVNGRNVAQQGSLRADGGGSVSIGFTGGFIDNEGSTISADGGGRISLQGGTQSSLFASGQYSARGAKGGKGGDIALQSDQIRLYGARLDASGNAGGGTIRLGGDYQGGGVMPHASLTHVNFSSVLKADAISRGDGGRIIVWSDRVTGFAGTATARGGSRSGNGGLIEVSSGNTLAAGGRLDASSPWGRAGRVLLDPKNITISNSGLFASLVEFELVDPNPAAGNQFGSQVTPLSTGNVVVTSTGDDFAATDAGAVYLFNGATGGLISTLRGSSANDQVGYVKALSNGNFVSSTPNWSNGTVQYAGSVTWGSGTTGVSGIVSAANSLVGSQTNDQVGSDGVTALPNGNYVVTSTNWNNGAASQAGAVTWGNGVTGTMGVVSAANSLVGSTARDQVGYSFGLTVLPNSNYVVQSPFWHNGGLADAGAITWGNGTTGITGAVSAANSLVGSHAGDLVGLNGITVLSNGNYVTTNLYWNSAAGAVTWANGATGITGAISAVNSLIGANPNDEVGGFGVYALSNGNYVVDSPYWSHFTGAVTWGNGTTGITGAVSAANSLVGSQANDYVGLSGVYELANGNYVVGSRNWANGGAAQAGAVTWGSGAGGISGAVSSANSLVGSQAGDLVGYNGITLLSSGNYVVSSGSWANGAAANAGAATWGNGATGTVGAVSAANSLVGSQANDYVSGYGITALTNGNYVITSGDWDNGAAANVGAVTWGNGVTGTAGAVSAANSLVGSQANERVGDYGVIALTNGNYVVASGDWANGAGAVTWGNGTGGISGAVSAANSLVGTQANDNVGYSVTALTNGNFVVVSPYWHNAATANTGAVTWGSGAAGISGAVSAANSLVGTQANDNVGNGNVTELANGNYVVRSGSWANGGAANAGAATWGSGTAGVSGVVSAANSLVGTQANDQVGSGGVTALANGNYVVISGSWANGAAANAGAATWGSGTAGVSGAITSANSILGPVANANLGNIVEDTVNGTFITPFKAAGRVYVASINGPVSLGSYDSFADMAGASVTLHPSFLTATLNTGSNVTLQASNDITVDDAIAVNNPGGNGGTLTLQAGRSILLNADITTDDGDLNLFANEKASAGVVNAQRDPGNAVIAMAPGVSINAGSGAVTFRLDDGAGNTNHGAGDVTLRSVTAGTILAQNKNSTGDIVLASGILAASGAGDAIVLASARNFINNAGAGSLSTPSGRWLTYSTAPANDTTGGLTSSFTRFSCVFGGGCPAFPGAGDGFLYSTASGGPAPSGNAVTVPQAVIDIISGRIGVAFVLELPSHMIFADLRLLDTFGLNPDMPNPWWDGIVW